MKKIIFLNVLLFAISLQAQVEFGMKGGLTYNADNGLFKAVGTTYEAKGSGSTGKHAGIFAKANVGILYIQPELWYVTYKNEFEDEHNSSFDIKYNRIEVPVSVGVNVFDNLRVQGGPVISYYFDDSIEFGQVSEVKQKDLVIGSQVGVSLDIKDISVGLRYDFPFGKRETEWVGENDLRFKVEGTPKLLHLSLGYTF